MFTRLPFGGCYSDYEQRRREKGLFLFLVNKLKYAGPGPFKIFPSFLYQVVKGGDARKNSTIGILQHAVVSHKYYCDESNSIVVPTW